MQKIKNEIIGMILELFSMAAYIVLLFLITLLCMR
jgi:hypothetical protein